MRVPVGMVKEMKRSYGGWEELARFAAAAGWRMKPWEAKALWEGRLGEVRMSVVEEFFWVFGYQLVGRRVTVGE